MCIINGCACCLYGMNDPETPKRKTVDTRETILLSRVVTV
jgi:hypothetical protein